MHLEQAELCHGADISPLEEKMRRHVVLYHMHSHKIAKIRTPHQLVRGSDYNALAEKEGFEPSHGY